MEKQQPLPTIVLVEDDPGHALLIEKNLRRAGIENPVVPLSNGRDALDYLAGWQDAARGPEAPPLLMLLDLNMPVLDGYGVLKAVKSDDRTRCIPIVVLTTTDSPRDVHRCYELGCNMYVTKPVEYEQFSNVMQKLGAFLSIVKMPVMKEKHG